MKQTDLEKGFRLGYLRSQIDNECISYGEIAELADYHDEIRALDDVVLAEHSGISEDDWNCPHAKDYQVANNNGGYDIKCRHCNEKISEIV